MPLIQSDNHGALAGIAATALVACLASPAAAQPPVDPNTGRMTLTGGIDVTNAYMFRGLRQDDTGVILWPFGDIGFDVFDGSAGLRDAVVNVGIWNSLHTGDAGTNGPSGRLWYESDFYTTLTLGFARGVNVGMTYTAYTSPNGSFSTVKEIAVRLSVDDAGAFTGVTLMPYALAAFEMDTSPGLGQADGGLNAGRYLELGIAPGWTGEIASIAFPVKVGLSLANYYELAGVDHTFGYFSVAGAASVPLGGMTDYGAWSVRGAVEFQALGDTPEAFNAGDQSKVVASIGVGLSY